ncbi:arginase family protein [Acinetobacter colistiniresistens]|uniref:arginase family protein n=1 Tax=Acinetobacter colistiniresistens TaxID=280145 RepID=UPI00211CDBB9|nr:arginase family protein [Acinetobacter colistiniresistens]UUM26130.1 arginase family protein [Acinetobacter colistiniresistens]
MTLTDNRRPIVLNFDDSAGEFEGALRLDLSTWQEMIRFGCKWNQFQALGNYLNQHLPTQFGCLLMGSGDYHHITQLLLARQVITRPIHLIVCDNHPDNMRYPFGIHCGSWVYWASQLPHIARIDVIGIHSNDIGWQHAWENHWSPLRKGKLHYWSLQKNASWTRFIGAKGVWHNFNHPDDLLASFLAEISHQDSPIYLSIDKDVLSSEVVMTNWDQGLFLEQHLQSLIQACQGRLIAADITGDISAYHYKNYFKRFLAASDGQQEPSVTEIENWQLQQKALNLRLVHEINTAWMN